MSRLFEVFDDLLHILLGLLDADHIVEGDLLHRGIKHLGPAFAKLQRAPAGGAHGSGVDKGEEQHQHQDRQQRVEQAGQEIVGLAHIAARTVLSYQGVKLVGVEHLGLEWLLQRGVVNAAVLPAQLLNRAAGLSLNLQFRYAALLQIGLELRRTKLFDLELALALIMHHRKRNDQKQDYPKKQLLLGKASLHGLWLIDFFI